MKAEKSNIKVNGVNLAYKRWGTNNDRRLMLIHGWTGFKEMWDEFAPLLAENDYDIIALDLRGHGDSDKPEMDYTHEVFSSDIFEFVKTIGWENGFILLGQSMGGYIVLDYALRYPETLTHVVPSNTSVYLSQTFISKIVWKLTVWMYKRNPRKMMEKGFPSFFLNPPPQEKIDYFVNQSLKTAKHAGLSAIKYCLERNLEPELHKIKVPTLVIASEHDKKTLRKATLKIHELVPNSKLIDIADTGHLPFMENQEDFLQAILEFTE